jgi:hypothetical protein
VHRGPVGEGKGQSNCGRASCASVCQPGV